MREGHRRQQTCAEQSRQPASPRDLQGWSAAWDNPPALQAPPMADGSPSGPAPPCQFSMSLPTKCLQVALALM